MRTKPLLAALIPGQQVLSLEVLRSFEELRDPKELPVPDQAAKPTEVKLARTLIDQMADEWDATEHPNEYRRALEKLLASKKKIAVKVKEVKRRDNVVDLMEALRKSVSASQRRGKRSRHDRAA
jgi:DNA end-binding protein Ku